MISISPSAAAQLRTMLADRAAGSGAGSDAEGLRIWVEKGGCAGMQYEMRLDVAGEGDVVDAFEGGCVFADPVSARFLEGASLDYCDDLVGTGFRLHNPNAVRSCGCGTSFEPADSVSAPEPLAESATGSGGVQEREATAGVQR
jgi:iron-sulfur cluster assembly protein